MHPELADAVVLAAGEGTRMHSPLPKVLHAVAGKTLVEHVITALERSGIIRRIGIVVGFKAAEVRTHLEGLYPRLVFFHQEPRNGSAHALMAAGAMLDTGRPLVVLCGDMPLITPQTINDCVALCLTHDAAVTVVSAQVRDPHGYGRIVKSHEGAVRSIVEELDATDTERGITEINSGMYCFRNQKLARLLERITPHNRKGELYLTDAIALSVGDGDRVESLVVSDPNEIMGVNTVAQLKAAEEVLNIRH